VVFGAFDFGALSCAPSVVATAALAGVALAGVAAVAVAATLAGVAGAGAAVVDPLLATSPLCAGAVVVEPVLDVPDDDVLGASGLCACLAEPVVPREVFAALEPAELVRSRPCVARLPLP
jgi:hypothetical protein